MHEPSDPVAADFISPLIVNGLHGRVMSQPASDPRQHRQILFVYGQHSSIERWWGMIQYLSNFGTVTVPDLPGFGGMDGLYKIGRQPTFDELADYLADFIRQQYDYDQFTVMGLSIGFAVVTRMLQRHPDLTGRVEHIISVVGFAHHDDFVLSKQRQRFYIMACRVFVHRPLNVFMHRVLFSPAVLRRFYHRSFNAREKFADKTGDEFDRTMNMELELWRVNDIRTWLRSTIEMFKLDNTRVKIPLPVIHLSVRKDRYFDAGRVERHYRQIFSDYEHIQLETDSHGPSVIATAEEAAVLIPPRIRQMFSQ
jgi:pimeloyl-ACP methyl ester carboxylesterase